MRVVAARDLSRAQAFAAQHGFAEALSSHEHVVTHPDVDLAAPPLATEGETVLIQQQTLDRVYEAAGLAALRRVS